MDILCVGQVAVDILVKPVDSVDFSVDTKRVESIKIRNGGDCLNTAIGLAILGNKVGFSGIVGDDLFADFLINIIESYGIDKRGLKKAANASTPSVVVAINKEGERTFFYYGGTNDTFTYEDIDITLIDEFKIVHVGGTYSLPKFDGEGAAKLFKLAQAKGKLTSMDVTWDTSGQWIRKIRPCFKYLNFFMPSINEARYITGKDQPDEIAGFLQNEGIEVVVVKLGKDGCYIKGKGPGFYYPAYNVKVADTTGAGDSFVAGFLTGVLKGWNLEKCSEFASAVAANCIQHIGATSGIPKYDDVLSFIKEHDLRGE
jgi:sugar/nucleoside kinase (ribokinase family)